MKKRTKKLLFSILVCALFAGVGSACGEIIPQSAPEASGDHFHTFGEWEEIPATCTEDGVRVRVCSSCGFPERERIFPALGHEMEEISRTDPTCKAEGSVKRKCSRCGTTETETLEKVDHIWGQMHVIEEATCEETGIASAVCEVCGLSESGRILPALGHEMEEISRTDPTCKAEGSVKRKCSRCGKTETETLEKVDHTFGEWEETPATCTEAGEKKRTCDVCGYVRTETIPPLGHNFDTKFTVDKKPTDLDAGLKSRHCLNPGCQAREEETPIDPLKPNTTYTVSLCRTTGELLPRGSTVIEFYNGEELAASVASPDARVTLPTGKYEVKVRGLPAGYAPVKESYEITAEDPVLEIRIPAHMIADEIPSGLHYGLGSVMYDMSVTVVGLTKEQDVTMSLYELFSQYKAVLLNMFYNYCSICVREMPAFVQAYNTVTAGGKPYGEEVACVMLSTQPMEDDREFKNQTNIFFKSDPNYPAEYRIPMILVHEGWLTRYFAGTTSNPGWVTAFPTSILIDCEGVIVESHVGGLDAKGFVSMMQRGIDRYHAVHAWREEEGLSEEETESVAFVFYDLAPDFTTVKRKPL